jgi:hypothetical protein
MAVIAAIMVAILAAIFNMVAKTHKQFRSATMLMREKPYISIFVEIGALRNFTHLGGHLKNGCQNDCYFEIALVMITFL